MKGILPAGVLLAMLPLGVQAGNCTGTLAIKAPPLATLSGNTICAYAPSPSTDTWQEWHQADGTLTEYALGPSDPIDPTHDVGTWTVPGDSAVVTYNYTGDGSYTWELWRDPTNHYYFCGIGTDTTLIATVTAILPGQQACP